MEETGFEFGFRFRRDNRIRTKILRDIQTEEVDSTVGPITKSQALQCAGHRRVQKGHQQNLC